MFDVIPQVGVRVPESCSIIYQLVVPLADYYTSKFMDYGAQSPALGILFQIVERERDFSHCHHRIKTNLFLVCCCDE